MQKRQLSAYKTSKVYAEKDNYLHIKSKSMCRKENYLHIKSKSMCRKEKKFDLKTMLELLLSLVKN